MNDKEITRWLKNACSYRASRALQELRVMYRFPFEGEVELTPVDMERLNRSIAILLEQENLFHRVCASLPPEQATALTERLLNNTLVEDKDTLKVARVAAIKYIKQQLFNGSLQPVISKGRPLLQS